MTDPKLRLYFVHHKDEVEGIAVAAHTEKEARRLAWKSREIDADSPLDLRANWCRPAITDGLTGCKIIYSTLEGLKRGVYGWVEDEDCPLCGQTATLRYDSGIVGCDECLEQLADHSIAELKKVEAGGILRCAA